jgi:hypothetical protein
LSQGLETVTSISNSMHMPCLVWSPPPSLAHLLPPPLHRHMYRQPSCLAHADIPGWNACHAQRAASMAAADEEQGPPLIFYGDSITERWLGTSQCAPLPPAQGELLNPQIHRTAQQCTLTPADAALPAGVPAVFARHFARFNASVMGIAADTTAHLMWRLTHGEAPVKHNVRPVG